MTSCREDLAADRSHLAAQADAEARVEDPGPASFYASLVGAYDRLRPYVAPDQLLVAAVDEAAVVSGLERIELLTESAEGWRIIHLVGGGIEDGVGPVEVRDGSAEEIAVRRARPAMACGAGAVHEGDLQRGCGEPCSVVVPIVVSGRVIGMFRAAHGSWSPVSRAEVATLASFAAALSGMWSSAMLAAGWSERIAQAQERATAVLQRARAELTSSVGLHLEDEVHDSPPCVGRRSWDQEDVHRLSPRGRAVLRGLLVGASNRQIAADLGLQVDTVRKYTRVVLKELGVRNRQQLNRMDPGGAELRSLLESGGDDA